MIVVDASVAAKWLLTEPGEQEAQRLLDGDERLVAPESIRVEVIGAVLRQFRIGKVSEQRARVQLAFWENLIDARLRLLAIMDLLQEAVNMALMLKHPLPDCFYIAAGKQLGVTVLTADRKMFERGKSLHEGVTLLEGVGPH